MTKGRKTKQWYKDLEADLENRLEKVARENNTTPQAIIQKAMDLLDGVHHPPVTKH